MKDVSREDVVECIVRVKKSLGCHLLKVDFKALSQCQCLCDRERVRAKVKGTYYSAELREAQCIIAKAAANN